MAKLPDSIVCKECLEVLPANCPICVCGNDTAIYAVPTGVFCEYFAEVK